MKISIKSVIVSQYILSNDRVFNLLIKFLKIRGFQTLENTFLCDGDITLTINLKNTFVARTLTRKL